jgi:hypothetical protein
MTVMVVYGNDSDHDVDDDYAFLIDTTNTTKEYWD